MLTALPEPDPARLFAGIDFASSPTVLVAVSGGGDSIALLSLLARHLPPSRLAAVTIDHALRPGSAAEAEAAGRFCRDLGVRHSISTWDGPKPATGLSAAARDARYRLLAQAARDLGAAMLFSGHTQDDQAETVAMRMARGEGRGLAGMAPATLLDGRLWLMRPLLGVRREALRAYLRANGIGWADDPTNEDAAYERVRVRRRLSDPAAFADAVRIAEQAAQERVRLGEAAAGLIATAVSPLPGLIRIDPDAFLAADSAAAVYALRLLLATAGGSEHLPDETRTAALLGRFGEPAFRASLSRTTLERRKGGIYLRREARGLPEPHIAADGEIWDGRFRLGTVAGAIVAPFGTNQAASPARAFADAPPALARAALATFPAIVRDGEPVALLGPTSHPGGPTSMPVAAPFARILPSFDLAPARALSRLIGGELPPPSPYAGHSAPRP
nr:tRNA lysidine(34) synthetase TilS [Mesorhizobium sp.]